MCIWTKLGMTQMEYKNLPWHVKREILISIYGQPTPTGESNKSLIDAYFQHTAEDYTIKNKYPHAVLSCGH